MSTFDEVTAARERLLALHHEVLWNPWVLEENADEDEQVMAVVEQWERAEPDHHHLTDEELEERWCRQEAEFAALQEAQEAERRARLQAYSAARQRARLALLESNAVLEHMRKAGLDEWHWAPAHTVLSRSQLVARVHALAVEVGDPEAVVDERGWLPAERREVNLSQYSAARHVRVSELRRRLADRGSAAGEATGIVDGAARHWVRVFDENELERLLSTPELTAGDMCAYCATPVTEHGYGAGKRPCVAWPAEAERWARIRHLMSLPEPASAKAAPPAPSRLAVLSPDAPIAELIARLQEIQADHPRAVLSDAGGNLFIVEPAASGEGEH